MAAAARSSSSAATAEAPETDRPNKVTVSDAGPCRKKLAIEIPAETVAEHLGESLSTLAVEAELPGFRKGRAPRRLVEKRFGSTVRREAKNQLVSQAFSRAVEEHKLRVIGDPTSESLAKVELEDGKPLAFEIEVEVIPTFELPSLDGIDVRKPLITVSDDNVNAEVERLKLFEGDLESIEKPQAGDYLTGHAVMKDDSGAVLLDLNDAVIQIPTADKNGKGMILGVMVEDFGPQVGTPKPGQTVTVKTTGPENHENESIRGKPLVITFEVARADRIIPLTGERLAERFGLPSESDVRDALRRRMEQRAQVEQQSLMRNQIAQHLIDSVQMDLPQRVTAQQAARNLERRRLDLMHRGVDPIKIEEHMAELRAASAGTAVRDLKLFFILNQVAENLNVKVSEQEINGRIAQMAISSGQRPEKLRQDLINRGQVPTVFTQIREHKTMDAILNKCTITEMPVEEYNAYIAEREKAHAGSGGAPAEAKSESKPKSSKAKKEADKDEGGDEAKAEAKPKKAASKKKSE